MAKSTWTPAAVRQAYNLNPDAGHFFDRATMRWFGDTMKSFGCTQVDGVDYMYRRRTAEVNVFGKWQTAGREFFGCYSITEKNGRVDVSSVDDDTREKVYRALYGH